MWNILKETLFTLTYLSGQLYGRYDDDIQSSTDLLVASWFDVRGQGVDGHVRTGGGSE